jgi:hypothetical protein
MKKTVIVFLAILLASCAGIEGKQYQNITPVLDLDVFFIGKVKAWGIVQDRSGNVIQRFTVDIDGSLQGDTLVLDETFEYGMGDGAKKRIWKITQTADGEYQGEAGDIAGPATGKIFGNALYWEYEMDLPVGESSYRVKFEDWMWAFDENTLMNRSYIRKFGITFAEVTLFMQRQ